MTEFENLDWEFSASGMRITAYTEEEKMVEVNVYESANWPDYTEIEIFWER